MFEIGQFIVYGSNGVCKVIDVGRIDMAGMSAEREYYTLEPFYSKGSRILTPTDNTKTVMRSVMTREEAEELMKCAKEAETLWIPDERKRESFYKSIIATCDCHELVRVIKTIYLRCQKRLAEGKKVVVSDEKYFKLAEDNLYNELAVVLEMSKDEAKAYMMERIEEAAAS